MSSAGPSSCPWSGSVRTATDDGRCRRGGRRGGGSMTKSVGVGVIGIGMGLTLAAVNRDPQSRLEVRGLCATRRDRLEAAAREWGIDYFTTDYRALIARPDVDVVGVFSPD